MKATAEQIRSAEEILASAERLPESPTRAEVVALARENLDVYLRQGRDDPADEERKE